MQKTDTGGVRKLLMLVLFIGLADCNTGSSMRLRMKRNVLAGKKIALIIPDARIYYTTRTSTVPNGDPFESFVDKGRVTRPQYADIYRRLKVGLEDGFGTKIDLYDPSVFESNFVFSRKNTEIQYHETHALPGRSKFPAEKYDIFIIVKIIEHHDCFGSFKQFKGFSCESKIVASLNNFEWSNGKGSAIRKLDYDDKSFIAFGVSDSFNAFTITGVDHFRIEETAKVSFEQRYAAAREDYLVEVADKFHNWGKEFAVHAMAEKEEPAK